MDILNQRLITIENDLDKIKVLKLVQEKTGVKPLHQTLAVILLTVLLVFFNFFAQLITDIFAFAYPTYKSILSLESQGDDDDKMWLTYWAVYAIFVVVDTYAHFILTYFPHYFILKLILLIWMMNPSTKGSVTIYNKLLRPLFLKYRDQIQKGLDKVKEKAGEIKNKGVEFAKQKGRDFIADPNNIAKVSQAVS